MRKTVHSILEQGRIRYGPLKSDSSFGLTGAFLIKVYGGPFLKVIASCDLGWEHTSASNDHRCPTWNEMCFVKDLFWEDEETVMQLHPPKSHYVNFHKYCLHLWRPIDRIIPIPTSAMVGPKT